LILCLGNEILGDDGFGAEVAKRLERSRHRNGDVEIVFAPLAGFAMLDLIVGKERALIVDTIHTGKSPPGTLYRFPAAALAATNHLTTSHQLSLPAAVELGRQLKWDIPDEIEVIAVEANGLEQFSDSLSEPVRSAVAQAVGLVEAWINQAQRG